MDSFLPLLLHRAAYLHGRFSILCITHYQIDIVP